MKWCLGSEHVAINSDAMECRNLPWHLSWHHIQHKMYCAIFESIFFVWFYPKRFLDFARLSRNGFHWIDSNKPLEHLPPAIASLFVELRIGIWASLVNNQNTSPFSPKCCLMCSKIYFRRSSICRFIFIEVYIFIRYVPFRAFWFDLSNLYLLCHSP